MAGDGTDGRTDPDVRFEFGHEPDAATQARRALEPLIDSPGDPIADDVRLVASELVTNVFLHTAEGGTVQAWDPKPDVPFRLEIADSEPTPPTIPTESPLVGGRGMKIVDACSDNWGIEPVADGKVVWAEFNRPLRGAGADNHPGELPITNEPLSD